MNKHQYQASIFAILAIAASSTVWTSALPSIALPDIPKKAVLYVETVLDRLFERNIVEVREVTVEDLGTHFSQQVLQASASVVTVTNSQLDITQEVPEVVEVQKQLIKAVAQVVETVEIVEGPVEAVEIKQEPIAPEGEVEVEVEELEQAVEVAMKEEPVEELHLAASVIEDEMTKWELSHTWNITIPSLGIQAPVLMPSLKYWSAQAWSMLETQMQVGLNNGSVAYPHSAAPGTIGNLIIAGHSSPPDEASKQSAYGHLFSKLPEIALGEEITVGDVTYRVQDKFVVSPSETSLLAQQEDESILKMITCYPVGTTKNRMIIIGKKVE